MEWTPQNIRGFKEKHRLTASAMAKLLGCNQSYVFLLMQGEREPSTILCRLLDCLDQKSKTKRKG